MAGIYLHIPFCQRRCNYCDFVSSTGQQEYYLDYMKSICQEIDLYRDLFPETIIKTIYFGGGTPSIFPAEYIANILNKLKNTFQIAEDAEITLEANPGTVTLDKFKVWHQAGVNRISFGLQAVQEHLLKIMGRIHSLEEAKQGINWAREAGINNLSLDLIYGLPEQTMADLQESIAWVVAQGVQHISIYGLQVEEGTVFAKWDEQGKLNLPNDEQVEAMYDYLTSQLPKLGYRRYEISNFAKDGYASKHNLSYWQDIEYLGLGAGAHSYYGGKRWSNVEELREYLDLVRQKTKPMAITDDITINEHMEEFTFLALRTAEGVSLEKFKNTFNREFLEQYGAVVESLVKKKLIWYKEDFIGLTALGMKYGNQVFQEFLL